MIRALLVALLLVGVSGCRMAPTDEEAQEQRLPDLTLEGLRPGDADASLRDLRGPMVISLWAQWCAPCREEMPVLQAFHEQNDDVEVLGIDWQDPLRERAIDFAEERQVTYQLVRDPDGEVAARYLPRLLLLDEDGRVVYDDYTVVTSVAQLERLVRRHLGVG